MGLRISVHLTPGDFLDRFAILLVKRTNLGIPFEDDCRYYAALAQPILDSNPTVRSLFDELVVVHTKAFAVLQTAIPHALNGGMSMAEHVDAIRLNRDRVQLRQRIDAFFGTPTDVKSYYGGQ